MKFESDEIQNLCLGIYDGPHATPPITDNGAIFLGISNITKDGHFNFSDIHYISEEDLPKWTRRVVPQEGDIVFSYEATLNLYGIIPQNFRGCLGRRMALIRPDNEKVLGKYLYYYFFSKKWRDLIQENTITGSTVDRIPLIRFPSFKIDYPGIDVQTRIIDILSAYDDLIENNQKQIKLLEEAAQRLYKEWFVDLRFPGHEQTKIVDGVPEGWNIQLFSQIFTYTRGRSYSSSDIVEDKSAGVLLVNLNNIKPFGGYKRNAEKIYIGKVNANQFVDAGDIVMGVTDMTQERRLVGQVAIVPNFERKATFSMDLIKVEPFVIPKSYIYASLRFGGYSNRISQLANGVNVLHLKPESIMNIKMLVPHTTILKVFDEFFSNHFKKVEILENQINMLTEARDRLLPKLMNGEIEV